MSESANESIVECLTDVDCSKEGIFKVCYLESKPEDNFCDCSIIHGWQGENCDEESLILTYTRFMTGVFLIIAFGFIFTSAWLLKTHLTVNSSREKQKAQSFKPLAILLTSVLFGSILLLISHSFILPSLIDPTQFELKDDSVVDKFRNEREFVLVGSGVFLVVASIQIIFTWYGVIHDLAKVYPERSGCTSDKKKVTTVAVIVAITVTFFVLIALGQVEALSIMSVVTGAVGCVFYTCGYFSLMSYLNAFVSWDWRESSGAKNIHLITFIYKWNVAALFGIFLFSSFGLIGQLEIEKNYKVGEFNFVVFSFDMAQASWYVFLASCIYYSYVYLNTKNEVSIDIKM